MNAHFFNICIFRVRNQDRKRMCLRSLTMAGNILQDSCAAVSSFLCFPMMMRPLTILKITAKYEKFVVDRRKAMAISWKRGAALDKIRWSEPCPLFCRLDLAPEKGEKPTTQELESSFHFGDDRYGVSHATRRETSLKSILESSSGPVRNSCLVTTSISFWNFSTIFFQQLPK